MKKIDLHIHTIATKKDVNFEFDFDKMQEYVQVSKLDAIAITNHNIFEKKQFDEIKAKLDIKVFPGVEVDLENGHMIVVADESYIDDFCEQCNQLKEKINDEQRFILFDEFIKIFNNYEKYLLIPHYKKKPAIPRQVIEKFKGNIICGEVDSVKKFCVLKKANDSLTPILLSDTRIKKDMEIFSTRHTFLDIEEITLKSIKYGLMDKSKVFISDSRNDNEFVFMQEGLVASTKLNIIMGKRSSGKTYILEKIKKSFEGNKIKYIKQFEITEKSGEEKFDKIKRKDYEKITNDYEKPIGDIISTILDIDLNSDDKELESYKVALINRAIDYERSDIFSKTILFNEVEYNEKENKELKKIIDAIKVLLDSETYREIINEAINMVSLQNLLQKFIHLAREEELEIGMKEEVDKLLKNIKKKLELKSSLETIPQIDLYNIIKNKLIVDRFNRDFEKIKEEKIIFEEEYQKFKIIATKSKFDNVSDMKGSTNHKKGSFKEVFEQYYETNTYEYIRGLKKLDFDLDKLRKAIVKIEYKVVNQRGGKLSGGEKAEFNLIRELEDAKNCDILLLDEPEASFDNIYIKENINSLIKDISNKATVFIVTHNNTLGISNKADKIIYTKYNEDEQEFEVYVGNFTDKELTNKDGKAILTCNAILNSMEAGEKAYEERRVIYENFRN